MVSSRATLSSVLALLLALPSVHATDRGLAWATDNNYAPIIAKGPLITWYHHWQDGPVSTMPSNLEYVPMFWGSSKWDLWNARKADMNKKWPQHLMGFNEPDISSQGNMDPNYAATVWMNEIQPYGWKGVKLISPAIAWDLNWLKTFMNAVASKGGNIDMVACHWYGSWNDIAGFKKFIAAVRTQTNRKIWVTELGITSSSNPTQAQTKEFMMEAFTWMQSTGYVDRASWFGCFLVNSPPDNYATGKNGLFQAAKVLSDMAYWYIYSTNKDRRELQSRHHNIAASLEARAEDDASPIHCDEICKLRSAQLDAYESALNTTISTGYNPVEGDEVEV
ncbi:glycosyl hydrolase catalytic core-domain-containing protein [Mycena floridula]|nr:glycosyl hydrolase catalytic core-domain-containing protein [Mycena floridula]